MTAIRFRSANPSMGALNTLVEVSPQRGQAMVGGAVPIGSTTSIGPSGSHR
jgi:hypothetical protein